jgi:hypothetical protein
MKDGKEKQNLQPFRAESTSGGLIYTVMSYPSMGRLQVTTELGRDLGELYFKHLCMHRGFANCFRSLRARFLWLPGKEALQDVLKVGLICHFVASILNHFGPL